jgi:hypothetical protein
MPENGGKSQTRRKGRWVDVRALQYVLRWERMLIVFRTVVCWWGEEIQTCNDETNTDCRRPVGLR